VKSSHLYISTHTNLVLAFTNTHYKPNLCCLELIFAESPIHPLLVLSALREHQPQLKPLLDALWKLHDHCLIAVGLVAAFHC
jgi:hypothetical protein